MNVVRCGPGVASRRCQGWTTDCSVRRRDDKRWKVESHVNAVWLAIGCTVLVFVALVTWIKGRRMPAEQGRVSEQWLSEQRMAQTQDTNR